VRLARVSRSMDFRYPAPVHEPFWPLSRNICICSSVCGNTLARSTAACESTPSSTWNPTGRMRSYWKSLGVNRALNCLPPQPPSYSQTFKGSWLCRLRHDQISLLSRKSSQRDSLPPWSRSISVPWEFAGTWIGPGCRIRIIECDRWHIRSTSSRIFLLILVIASVSGARY
jgi:hypothetical protein